MASPISFYLQQFTNFFCFDRRREDAPGLDSIMNYLLSEIQLKASSPPGKQYCTRGMIFFVSYDGSKEYNDLHLPFGTVGLSSDGALYDLVDGLFLTCSWCRYPGIDKDTDFKFLSIDQLFAGTPSQMDRNGRYYELLKSESVEGILNDLSEAEGRLLLECLSGISAFYWNSVAHGSRSSMVSSTFRTYQQALSKTHDSLSALYVGRIADQNLNPKIQALRKILAEKGIAVNS